MQITAVDKFSGVLGGMSSSVDKFNKRTAGLERANSKLNSLKYHALAGGAALGVTVKSANDFQSSMSNVSTLLDTNVENMDKMGKDVLNLSKKLPVPIEELTTSLYDIRSAGISAGEAMGALETAGRLSVAGLASTGEATNILTSAMNAFKSEGLSSEQIANILFKTVKAGKTDISQLSQAFGATASIIQATGVKLADFQAATAALTLSGTPAAQAQNQIKAAMVQLQKPTADMVAIFKELGVSTGEELIQKKGGILGAMEAINQGGGKIGANLAKAWSSSEALGAVKSLTGAARDSYLGTLKDMESGSDSLSGAFNKQAETEASRLKIAQNNMQALSITIGTVLAPMITQLVEKIVPLIQAIGDFISKNEWVIGIIPVMVGAFVAFKAILIATRIAVLANSIAMGVQAAAVGAMSLSMKGNIVAQTAFKIAMGLSTAATWIATVATTAFGIALNLGLWPILAIIAAIVAVVLVVQNWGAITDWFGEKWTQFTSFISEAWSNVVNWFSEFDFPAFFMSIGQSIIKFMLFPLRTMLGLLAKLPGGIGEAAQSGLDTIDGLIAKVAITPEEEPLPSTTQATNTNLSESVKNSRLNIDIKDKGNNVEKVTQTQGDAEIPIKTTNTVGAF